jgi:hypothetical protein
MIHAILLASPILHHIVVMRCNKIKLTFLSFVILFGLFTKSQEGEDASFKGNKAVAEFLIMEKKILIAFLPLIIMNKLIKATVVRPTQVISIFSVEFGIELSPGTIYPIFRSLEREGKIRRLPDKTNTLHILTSKGKESLEYFSANSVKIFTELNKISPIM